MAQLSLPVSRAVNTGHEDNSSEKRGFRSADTVEVVDQALADCIWERVQSRITQTITIAEGDARWERGFGGTWHACGVNEHLLFAKYALSAVSSFDSWTWGRGGGRRA